MNHRATILMACLGVLAGAATVIPYAGVDRSNPTSSSHPPPSGLATAPSPARIRPAATSAGAASPPAFSVLDFIDRHTDPLGGSENDGPSHALTDQDGAISRDLLIQLDIPPELLPQLQQELNEIKSRASTVLASRMRPDPRASLPAKGIAAYDIPPDADEATGLRRDLDTGFTPIVGSEKSAALIKACSVLAGFGSDGLTLKVTTNPASGEKVLLFEQYSARTRQPSLSGTINTPEQITARFGPAFRHLLQP